ncbi:MAG: ATP-binding protein [Candidatus Cloacimonetes bacterium]|nr:ATP-binding protein [Candidatus Cloacimonadota bacterium]
MKIEAQFKTRARLLEQLGEQLIRNESVALLELIKNSYDADASYCKVTMREPWDVELGKIIIEDDGEGMNEHIIKKAWLEIGTDYKSDIEKNKLSMLTKKYHRKRLGEKGIGRFGVHKLGRIITIITRRDEKEFVVTIKWDQVSQTDYIESLPVLIIQRDPKHFINSTGTVIEISKLRNAWTKQTARESARIITSLNSPFEDESKFRTEFNIIGSDWLSGLPAVDDILSNSLFSFDVTMKGDSIVDFDYRFSPWGTMDKISNRHIDMSNENIKKTCRMIVKDDNKEIKTVDLDIYRIGKVRFRGVIFDLDAQILSLMNIEKTSVKKYLDNNGGIRVYRDSMRVLDYGEPNTDWLGLGVRRINLPTKRVSNNLIIGAVYISAESSMDLVEKSNREGFIENNAFITLRNAVLYALNRVESQRQIDKDRIRIAYNTKSKTEPVNKSIRELEEFVEKRVAEPIVKKQIYKYLDRIRVEYQHVIDVLIKSAGAGLAMFTVLHQVEKMIKELILMNQNEVSHEKIEDSLKLLSRLVEGYSVIVRKTDVKKQNINKIVNRCLDSMIFRIRQHEVEVVNMVKTNLPISYAICSENHVMNSMISVIDNSLWWLDYSRQKIKKIFVNIVDAPAGHTSIIIADNGCGFTLSPHMMIQAFVTEKPDGTGIGLHLTEMLMKFQEGMLLFPDFEDFEIPQEFSKGAIIQLAFKKE